MADISASMVKELRDKSGAAMMDCKKALVEANGNFDKAIEWLRQKGMAVATKKASRTATEGLVVARVADDLKSGVIVEVNCETDFVARNEEFVALCQEIAATAFETKSLDAEVLMKQKHGAGTVADFVTEKVAKTGENMVVRRLVYVNIEGPGAVGSYIHALGGKMGAILAIKSSKDVAREEMSALCRELSMHIVSAKPQYISRTEVPVEVVENERRIEAGKEDLAKKPAEIRDKIVSGRVDKLMAERCFLDQPFVKDPNQTIAQYLKQKGTTLGAELTPVKFALFILGEMTAEPTAEAPPSNGCCQH